MAKRRVKNNFRKWLLKSIPFFLIVFFVCFNISFFVFNSSTYAKRVNDPESTFLQKFSSESSFTYAMRIQEKETIKEMLEIYRMEKDDYPLKLENAVGELKNKNWLYTKSADRYILEYKE
ncbi:MAG: hypothetical protein R2877_07250 [Bdellovibrionota bacterium]